MDNQMLEYFMKSGQLNEEGRRAEQMRARADALRNMQTPQGGQMVGGAMVPTTSAAGWNSILSQLGGAAMGGMADMKQNDLSDQRLEALRALSSSYGAPAEKKKPMNMQGPSTGSYGMRV